MFKEVLVQRVVIKEVQGRSMKSLVSINWQQLPLKEGKIGIIWYLHFEWRGLIAQNPFLQ